MIILIKLKKLRCRIFHKKHLSYHEVENYNIDYDFTMFSSRLYCRRCDYVYYTDIRRDGGVR